MAGGVSADTPLFFIPGFMPGTGQVKGFSWQVSFISRTKVTEYR